MTTSRLGTPGVLTTYAAVPVLAVMTPWIVDTGPLVAYVDADDPAHAQVTACWDAFSGRLATTSAVITEAMHFVLDASS